MSVDDAADRVLKLATEATGARWAELLTRKGSDDITVLAATDIELTRRLRQASRDAGESPQLPGVAPVCDALVIDDLATDERWPVMGPLIAERTPVRSAVLQFVTVLGRFAAVMPVYDERPGYFTADLQQRIGVIATLAAPVLAELVAAEQVSHLQVALKSNRVIGAAVGMTMKALDVDSEEALGRLITASHRSNRKLVDIADDVVQGRLSVNAVVSRRAARVRQRN